MKRILSIAMLSVVLSVFLAIPAKAGEVSSVKNLVDAKGQFNKADWIDPTDKLTIEDGALVIPNDSTAEARVISKAFSTSNPSCETMVTVSANLQFTQLADGEKFILASGLQSVEAYSGENKNVEVEFTKQNGVSVGVTAYDESGEAVQVAAPKTCAGSINAPLAVKVEITTAKQIFVTVNNKQVISAELPVSGEGRVGVLQTGNCGAKVRDLTVLFAEYDRPENTDFTEDFETDIYNTNLFTLKFAAGKRTPAYLSVEEFEGSNVLRFKNSGLSYFGTKHLYSNFELTFDVPYFVRNTVTDEEGNTLELSTMFGVSFGDLERDYGDYVYGYAGSTDMVYFDNMHAISHNYTEDKFVVTYNDKGFFDTATNEGFSVRMKMVDGHYTLEMKALDATEFTKIAETDYNMRTGYIKFWTLGDGNVALDNIKLTNLDDSPNSIEVPFRGATISVSDYEYQEDEMVFKSATSGNEAGVPAWQIVSICLAAGAVVVVAVGAIVMTVQIQKKKKQTEVKENEK